MSDVGSLPGATRVTEKARLALANLPPDAPLNLAFFYACEVAADALQVERVGVWLFVEDRSALRCASLFEREKREHSSGAVLRVADFPTYFASLSIRKAVPAELAATDPRTAELAAAYLVPLGISSMLDAGIFVNADLLGVVCHEHVGPPREWTTEERDFAGSVADRLAVRIQTAKVNELQETFRSHKDQLGCLQKAQALELLAGGVAHDFANLLSIIGGNAHLLERRDDLPDDAREQARDVAGAAERGHALMRELREFSRPGARPAALDLGQAAAEFLPLLRGAVGLRHEVELEHPPCLGRVLIDRTQYSRVLLNLVMNARDAMPGGGVVRVTLTAVKVEGGADAHVRLDVRDAGVGMDEATKRRAFDPFFTTKAKGTGLGLSVVQRIADQAGGSVSIESALGKGTTVRVYFPRVGAGE